MTRKKSNRTTDEIKAMARGEIERLEKEFSLRW